MTIRTLIPLLASVLLVSTITVVASTRPATSAPQTYSVDNVHSCALFRIRHLGVSNFYGRFNELGGTFTFDDADAANNSMSVVIKAGSIDTNSKGRDDHLKSPQFFDTESHPEMTFDAGTVKKVSDTTYRAEGTLTFRGVSRPQVVDLERIGTTTHARFGHRTGFETSFTIKRSDFGMDAMLDTLGDEVKIIISVEGTAKTAE